MYSVKVAGLAIFIISPSLVWASVAGQVNKANDLYKQGKFDDSLGLYQKALDQDDKSSVVQYDLGTAWYKKGDYVKAQEHLEKATLDKNINIKSRAEYNLGNALYKSGIQKENTNVDEAIKSLQQALGHYAQAIAYDIQDKDAPFNQDFVRKEIERLKQKKQQQQQQQQQQNQKQQQQNQDNQQSQQSQQNQQKQQDSQQKQQDSQQKQQENQAKQQENQQSQQNSSQDQKNQQAQQQDAQAQAQQDQKEFDRKQAEDILEDYRQNEEPKKLLDYMPKKIDDRPVLKDW